MLLLLRTAPDAGFARGPALTQLLRLQEAAAKEAKAKAVPPQGPQPSGTAIPLRPRYAESGTDRAYRATRNCAV
eukprot:384881-Rhodomonas_salina.1